MSHPLWYTRRMKNMKTNNELPSPPEVIWVEAPDPSSPDWNDFAATHPTWAAKALGKLDIVKPMMQTMKAIATGARPIEN